MYHQEQNTSRHPTPQSYLQPFGNLVSPVVKKTQEIRASTLVGTPEYLAPEAVGNNCGPFQRGGCEMHFFKAKSSVKSSILFLFGGSWEVVWNNGEISCWRKTDRRTMVGPSGGDIFSGCFLAYLLMV